MRGKILGVDPATGKAQISGEDGQRYEFERSDWSAKTGPAIGAEVDFDIDGKNARSVFRIDSQAVEPVKAASAGGKNKIVAALLAFFLGPLGVHKFYLGYNGAGLAMLLISIFGIILLAIPTAIIGLIAFIEFIIYLVTDEEDFQERYVKNSRTWF